MTEHHEPSEVESMSDQHDMTMPRHEVTTTEKQRAVPQLDGSSHRLTAASSCSTPAETAPRTAPRIARETARPTTAAGRSRGRRWAAIAGLVTAGLVACGGTSSSSPSTLSSATLSSANAETSSSGSAGRATTVPAAKSSSAAASGTSVPQGAVPVTLVLDWSPNTNHGGIYLAQAQGWYAEAGIDLTIIEPGDSGALQAAATGSAQFAISSQEELTPARASGVPVVSIAGVIAHNTSSLMSLASSKITRPADLVGKRYGGWGGILEQAIVDALVTCDGADPKGVEFVSVGDADYRVGLESGQYDTVWVYDGWDKIRFDLAGIATDTIPFAQHLECIPDWYTPLIATSDQMIADSPEVVQAFVDATARGYRAAIDDPGAAAEALLAAAPELDRALVTESAKFLSTRFADDPVDWGMQNPAVWERFTQFLDSAGMLDGPIDPATAFTNRFVDAANASPTSLDSGPATTTG